MVDLESAVSLLAQTFAGFPANLKVPRSIREMLDTGDWQSARETSARLTQDPTGAATLLKGAIAPLASCQIDTPFRPGKLITVARNYREHLKESGVTEIGPVPSASIKASSVVGAPYADIVRPVVEKKLDYETELVVVIGKRCKDVRPEDVYQVIGGYMVMNDVIAREILGIERKAGNQFLGKMFDSFAPTGPYFVTADEVPDPMNLEIRTRVNGELRQQGNTRDMIWNIPQLVSYFSQTTLEPGDIISTGTPAGVAAGRRPGEAPWFLLPGDVLESEVQDIGCLKNRIVQEPDKTVVWDWARRDPHGK